MILENKSIRILSKENTWEGMCSYFDCKYIGRYERMCQNTSCVWGYHLYLRFIGTLLMISITTYLMLE